MRSRLNYPVAVLVTGFIVLMFLSLAIFWASWICKSSLADLMPLDDRSVDITPSGLDPAGVDNDPNLVEPSAVYAHIIHPEAPQTLGIWDYLSSRIFEGRNAHVWYLSPFDEDPGWMYFDKRSGQIYCHWIEVERMPDGTRKQKTAQLYVGPEGVSEVPDKKIGRFSSVFTSLEQDGSGGLIFYDRDLRRFFAINLEQKTITKGQQLLKDDPHKPLDIGIVTKNRGMLDLYWRIPVIKSPQGGSYQALASGTAVIRERDLQFWPDRYVLVLDESGRIDLLDTETLEFAGAAGYLPVSPTVFRAEERW